MEILTGEYTHQLDAKNRIRIPNKLKGKETTALYFGKGKDSCIYVFSKEYMEEKFGKLGEISLGDSRQKGVRTFSKSFQLVESDPQGRMVIPQNLLTYAGIDKDIMICGNVTHIEIWSKQAYEEYFKDEDTNFDALFSELGI